MIRDWEELDDGKEDEECYMQASYLDGYRNQIAQLQQQMTNSEILLTAYLESYATCIGGAPA